MDLGVVKEVVGSTPHMPFAQAEQMRKFLHDHDIKDVLELGFRYGVSTSYIAAALDEAGGGHITTIDLDLMRGSRPGIETHLEALALTAIVDIHYEPTSYNWRLMKMLEEDPTPRFDLCYIDGAHDWFTDGFAFFLVDRLLRPGGWIIFDDIEWTYANSVALSGTPRVQNMPAEERETKQVRKIYELLVRTHPGYSDFRLDGQWAYAKKSIPTGADQVTVVTEQVVIRERYGVGAFAAKALRTLRDRGTAQKRAT